MTIDFSRELEKAAAIVDRFLGMDLPIGSHFESFDSNDRFHLIMDMLAADGVNGNPPLDFDRMAQADDFNVAHDVVGIYRHIDRETGKLTGCFLPRFAKLDAA